MQLSGISIKDFKRVQKIDISLATTNILVGANGSGKSSVLQALHLASCMARQADRVEKAKPNTVSITEVDYLPTNQYKKLGHNADWGNKSGSPASVVMFRFSDDTTTASCDITLRSARNAGISISGTIPAPVNSFLRSKDKFFSSYVPGLSGIPNSEKKESKRVVLRASSFGDSNVYLRNILLILKTEKPQYIEKIESFLSRLIDPIRIIVEHDDDKDLEIRCFFERNRVKNQIELLGTGYLQVIQMLSYIYLFEPKLLLIDEPDTHLHPSAQEILVSILEEAAEPFGTKIIMSTHSPFIVRGASARSNVYWLADGGVLNENRSAIEQALGWGAMGKKALLISEDSNVSYLRQIIRQWPEIERQVAVLPGTGFRHLPSPEQARQLSDGLEKSVNIILLRDTDFLTVDEKLEIESRYNRVNVRIIFTKFTDIEHYICEDVVLSRVCNVDIGDVRACTASIIQKHEATIDDMFAKSRKAHNDELHGAGGGPTNAHIWATLSGPSFASVKGKFLMGQLSNAKPLASLQKRELAFDLACDGTFALDIKAALESALAT